jgi:hypothetical protein
MQHHPPARQINLAGLIPNQIHSPTLFAQSQTTHQNVFLLLDTGYSGECAFEISEKAIQFRGPANDAPLILGSITAVNPVPQVITYGEFLGNVNTIPGNLARSMQLMVKKAHVDGITAAYLLGPLVDNPVNPYPNRLIAFWNTHGMPQCTINMFPPGADGQALMQDIYGHPVTFYATPISLLPPGSAGIPAVAVNEIQIPIFLDNHIPVSSALSPHGVSFKCVWDTGASFNVIRREVAQAFNLNYETGSHVIIPQLDFLQANPTFSLLNVPAIVDNDYDQIVLGSNVLDHFTTVVLDFGTGLVQNPFPGVQANIRLLP